MINHRKSSTLSSVLLISLALSSSALAEGPGWSAPSTVKKLIVTWDGSVLVRLSPELQTCVALSGYGSTYASISTSHPGVNRMKASLLLAFANGTPVSLYFTDNTCRVGEMVLGGPY